MLEHWYEIPVSSFLSGLSVGAYCLTYCIPFVAPVMVSEERSKKSSVIILSKFILGRFIGYMAFGALVGYLGETIKSETASLAMTISLMLLSIIMIFHTLNLLKPKRLKFCIASERLGQKLPLLMGFLMGVNICPPFLMSLTYVFTLHDFHKGMVFFLIFFIGTSIYFLPLLFLGPLGRSTEFRFVGRLSAVVVGVIFLMYSFYKIIHGIPTFGLGSESFH